MMTHFFPHLNKYFSCTKKKTEQTYRLSLVKQLKYLHRQHQHPYLQQQYYLNYHQNFEHFLESNESLQFDHPTRNCHANLDDWLSRILKPPKFTSRLSLLLLIHFTIAILLSERNATVLTLSKIYLTKKVLNLLVILVFKINNPILHHKALEQNFNRKNSFLFNSIERERWEN